ncbi:hypothetical protein TSA66_00845 [Noviherbaspirillum autotrophicum]|uniref:Uncharacterized protein n=1 Tax=Noviherbaspirillum autotrophicum TaxID=709839 RepID=A0A0C1YTS1_9BURK|nr:hypothetical protein TSA66_00845 [Noviherbaspirillum autotrophicum]
MAMAYQSEKAMGSQRAKAHYGPALKRASSQRLEIRAQSYLDAKNELIANEEESIYGHSKGRSALKAAGWPIREAQPQLPLG